MSPVSRDPVKLLPALVALADNADELAGSQVAQCADDSIQTDGMPFVDSTADVRCR
jgi:hypothetical protein